ncbi:drug:proton antiporter [Pigmentiphaga litoralis]|uniref:VOC family protein n=1 Tax=Pigmentiphaga litoralis TaxID=516702 RepID=UPI00167579BA|nr:VOC family protein [Pigmentiphaga litoralis]GGX24272.1 drug:proton antiporter [Pigmentiphaga litoralis]
MPVPSMTILYVDNAEQSGAFYARLLGQQPIEASTTFLLFVLANGLKLGLWSKHTCTPAPATTGGGSELAMVVDDRAAVDALYQSWSAAGMTVLQSPVLLDFGYTFVVADPDGHRVRVYTMIEA